MQVIINIDVPALEPAIDFYKAALDLQLKRIIDDDVAELSGASTRIYLLVKPPGSAPANSAAQTREYTRHWTPVHMDFVVKDIARARKQALAAGAIRESDCVQWRGSKCITFADPFGHGFCLLEFAHGDYTDH